MDVKLTVVSAKTGTKEIFVRRPRILGRAHGIGIVIPHSAVSERHCLLFDNAGLLMVQDLNSEHGTFIDGRKIILAPLPPGAEFSVGPLTFRAEYVYTGSPESLPKTLFDGPEPEPAAPIPNFTLPPVESAPHPQNDAPAEAATPQFSSFFGFDPHGELPSVAPPAHAAPAPRPQAATPTLSTPAPAKRPPVPMPPPLPKVPEPPPAPLQEPEFCGFSPYGETGNATPQEIADAGLAIPGLNFDAPLPEPPPPAPQPPKKSSGSFLDYFSKRPARKKRVSRSAPEVAAPPPSKPNPPAPVAPPPAIVPPPAPSKPIVPMPPAAEPTPPEPESVDDDLSSFFKNLQ